MVRRTGDLSDILVKPVLELSSSCCGLCNFLAPLSRQLPNALVSLEIMKLFSVCCLLFSSVLLS